MKHYLWVSVTIIAVMLSHEASARIGAVVNAKVKERQVTAFTRVQYTTDDESKAQDNRMRHRMFVDYGVNEWYAVLGLIETQDLQGESPEVARYIVDQRIELTTMEDDGFYSGFRVRYEHWESDNQVDTTHIRLIAGKEIGNWDFRLNQIWGAELGANRQGGMIWDSRSHVSYKYNPLHHVGIESFHQLGNIAKVDHYSQQQHYVGPTFFGALTDKVRYEVGYMTGISRRAPDHAFYIGFNTAF
ncbi:MAG: hypothetical protein EAZ74_05165 [Alphaproteobacteria bacterium]|nr:MAG: hypothetical protein EAY76_06370 [Alphaproteobacteria bacterium]TAF13740.1 MAG: hypothetical protein EAZ74_05165 [Alphaproteobacteria bacterium]TAF41968.1 MAG: hypothetical protein EAZ66_00050 [Alphaproteobacteria bacterium]TAF76576.1 MAG: hypothetical protein EAZ52_03345 [Alphaproteobacteria bacterium]